MQIQQLTDILHSCYPEMDVMAIRHENLIFEQRVRLKCFHCRNYQTKWTCPAHLPQLDYERLVNEYEHLAVVTYKVPVAEVQNEQQMRSHSNKLHEALLFLESELMKSNHPLAQAFIGSSCQLCEEGCAADKCV